MGILASAAFGVAKAVVFIALPAAAITTMAPAVFWIFLAFLALAMSFAVHLNKKYDYKNVGDITFNANKIMVGACYCRS
jgi:hypothetical protein